MFAARHQPRQRLHVLGRVTEVKAGFGGGLFLAGERADDPSEVLAHAVPLVLDIAALAQIERAAGPGEGQRPQQLHRRQARRLQIRIGADACQPLPQRHPGVGPDHHAADNRGENENHPHEEHLQPFHGVVDNRTGSQNGPARDQAADAEQTRGGQRGPGDQRLGPPFRTEEQSEQQFRRGGGPARKGPGDDVKDQKDPRPLPAQPAEPGNGAFAGDKGPAPDLHVDEELRDNAQQAGPEKNEARVIDDVRPEDEFPRPQG